jgi:hypothetical protein
MPPSLTWDDDNALGLTLLLNTAGVDIAHNRNNTTINHNNGRGQNAAEATTRWEDNDSGSNGNN